MFNSLLQKPTPNAYCEMGRCYLDSGGEFGAGLAGIGGFKRYPSNGSQAQIDGCGCVLLLFEIDPVYRRTAVRLNARGSEQYQSTKSVMARS